MNEIDAVNGISSSPEIKAIEASDQNYFYEDSFNSMLQKHLAEKNAQEKKHSKNSNSKNGSNNGDDKKNNNNEFEEFNFEEEYNSNYDEKLDNSKTPSIISELGKEKVDEEYLKHDTVFISLSKNNEKIPVHKCSKFTTKLRKMIKYLGKSIKLFGLFIVNLF
ncbi:hypothetical protein AAEX28_06140 [Lentisphaerota bacterium WC36G]|nr:hypothetical protein LJT99_09000 [Lentisphaerae bacterium WC36]